MDMNCGSAIRTGLAQHALKYSAGAMLFPSPPPLRDCPHTPNSVREGGLAPGLTGLGTPCPSVTFSSSEGVKRSTLLFFLLAHHARTFVLG